MTATDAERWRELAQQLRVDSVASRARPRSGHPTSSLSAADLMAVLVGQVPALRRRRTRGSAQRPPDLLQGPRVAARTTRSCSRPIGAIDGRGVPHLPQARQPARRSPDADPAVGRRRHRLARPGPADRRRRRARRQAARPARLPRLGAVRRQRDGRGLDVGGVRARPLRPARQPDRDHRRQPARPDRPDDATSGISTSTPKRCARSAGTRSRSTGTTWTRSTAAYAEALAIDATADRDRRQDDEGQGRRRRSADKNGAHGKPVDDPEAAIAELGGERNLDDRRRGSPRERRQAARRSRPGRWSCRATSSARRSRRARRTATRWRRWARHAATWSRSTARSATRPTPRSSPRRIPSGSSRCTSPSSR